jgi:hypothetical protein
LNILQFFTIFVDVNHEYLTIWCEAFGTSSPTFFVVRRSEKSAFFEREFSRVDNGSWWALLEKFGGLSTLPMLELSDLGLWDCEHSIHFLG